MVTEGPFLDWKADLLSLGLVSKTRWNESLKRFNTLKIGGEAACLIDVESDEELTRLMVFLKDRSLPWVLLGKGSNVLIADGFWNGVFLRLAGRFKEWTVFKDRLEVLAGAAVSGVTLAQHCIEWGWSGLEFLIGVPGSIGGEVAMNAGAHGQTIDQVLKEVWWLDFEGKHHHSLASDLTFAYRDSPISFQKGGCVTRALFQLLPEGSEAVRQRTEHYRQLRVERQPQRFPNCGSVFKNPPGFFAAALIESVGLKGFSIGGSQISEKHSNFIINRDHARATDILALIQLAQQRVQEVHGVLLETEVQILQPW